MDDDFLWRHLVFPFCRAELKDACGTRSVIFVYLKMSRSVATIEKRLIICWKPKKASKDQTKDLRASTLIICCPFSALLGWIVFSLLNCNENIKEQGMRVVFIICRIKPEQRKSFKAFTWKFLTSKGITKAMLQNKQPSWKYLTAYQCRSDLP